MVSKVLKTCFAMRFLRHPRGSSNLLKLVRTQKKEMFKQIKIYCYKSIISSLTEILSCPRMIAACEQWKNHNVSGLYADIYDGNI